MLLRWSWNVPEQMVFHRVVKLAALVARLSSITELIGAPLLVA